MELISRLIPAPSRTSEILLMPVGDIQWSGRDDEVAMKMLQRHIKWGVEHGAYFLGMGDYIDFLSPSNRARLASAALYDTAAKTIDDTAHRLVQDLYNKALKPSKGRWLGLLEGHHFHEDSHGITSDQWLSKMLGAPFLGTSAIVRLVLANRTKRGAVKIWCHHGVGGSSTVGAPVNKIERLLTNWGSAADIFLMGHHHKKVAAPVDMIESVFDGNGGPRLVHRTKILACTGGFLKGYVVGAKDGDTPRGGYVEQGMMNPVALGGVLVRIKARWSNTLGFNADLSVEA